MKPTKPVPQDCRTCAFARVRDLTPKGRWGQYTHATCGWRPPESAFVPMPKWCTAIEVSTVNSGAWNKSDPAHFDQEDVSEMDGCPTWQAKDAVCR